MADRKKKSADFGSNVRCSSSQINKVLANIFSRPSAFGSIFFFLLLFFQQAQIFCLKIRVYKREWSFNFIELPVSVCCLSFAFVYLLLIWAFFSALPVIFGAAFTLFTHVIVQTISNIFSEYRFWATKAFSFHHGSDGASTVVNSIVMLFCTFNICM